MAILKISDNVELYRFFATSGDLHTISGRGDDVAGTEFANSRILELMELTAEDTLLDIGCGDGFLLQAVNGRVAKRIGTVSTGEEEAKLQLALPDVTLLTATVQKLPLESGTISKIVCNGVLILLSSEEEVANALTEISRVTRPGGLVFLGEIPAANELDHFNKYRGNSVFGFLMYELRRKGLQGFVRAGRSVASALLGRQTLLLNSAKIFYAPPDKFIKMASDYGLRPITHFKYKRLRSGEIIESPFRYNYVFHKA